jgi:hypothetical protein
MFESSLQGGETMQPNGPRPLEGNIFVSYRRSDSADVVGRLLDRLGDSVGGSEIFRDIDDIELGADFAEAIDAAITSASVLLVAIGPTWLGEAASGGRRIDDPRDFVRLEVAAALAQDIPIIPLLVRGADMPRAADLPPDIEGLALRNGIQIRPDPDFDIDVERLSRRLEPILPAPDKPLHHEDLPGPGPLPRPTPQRQPGAAVGGCLIVALLAVAVIGFVVWKLADSGGSSNDSTSLVVHSAEATGNFAFVNNPLIVEFSITTEDDPFRASFSGVLLIDSDNVPHNQANTFDTVSPEVPANSTRRFAAVFDVDRTGKQFDLEVKSFGPNPVTVTAPLP